MNEEYYHRVVEHDGDVWLIDHINENGCVVLYNDKRGYYMTKEEFIGNDYCVIWNKVEL